MARNYYGRKRNPWFIAFFMLLTLMLGFAIGYFFFFRKARLGPGKDQVAAEVYLPEIRKSLQEELELLERASGIHEEGIAAAELLRRFIAEGGVDSDSLLTAYQQLFVMPELPGEAPWFLPTLNGAGEKWSAAVSQWYGETLPALSAIQKNRSETQFLRTYYPLAIDWISNNQWFDEQGRLVGFRPAPRFNASLEKYRMLNLLDRMIMGRRYARKTVAETLQQGKAIEPLVREAEREIPSRETSSESPDSQ